MKVCLLLLTLLTGPPAHGGGAAQVAAGCCHGDDVQASRGEHVEGAVSGLLGEEPLDRDGGGASRSDDSRQAVPLTGRSPPLDAQRGFISETDKQQLDGPRG